MADTLTKLAYQALQQGKSLVGVAHKEVSTKLMELVAPQGAPKTRPIPPQMLQDLQAANAALMDIDWSEAEQGLYPTSLLFDAPWLDWAARYPMVWLDMPSTWNRRSERNVTDLPKEVQSESYPGCTLRQIRAALPQAQLVGLDLSPSYLRQANRWLSQLPSELPQLVQGNGEAMPFAGGSMQAVTCVFLLHELPAEARQNVINDCFRVLEPGGTLVLADSVQLADSPQFETAMDNFRRVFHEPYYRDYIGDDIDARLASAGFQGIRAESHLMTRVWSAIKP